MDWARLPSRNEGRVEVGNDQGPQLEKLEQVYEAVRKCAAYFDNRGVLRRQLGRFGVRGFELLGDHRQH